MRYLAHIADRVFGRPLMIHPRKAEIIVAVLGERIGAVEWDQARDDLDPIFMRTLRDAPAANRLIGKPGGPRDELGRLTARLYNMVDSVAVIPVVGSLINRGAFVGDDGSGFTSYEGLSVQVQAAAADPNVQSILFDIESPGGETAGALALYDTIRQARARKPVVALVNDMAASAAYGIAASADEIVVSPGSVTGSVGVVLMHLDRSQQMAKKGIKPTFVFAGAKKVDGNPFEPLSESVLADLQREVDMIYKEFVGAVAAGRPGLTTDQIRGSEAGVFIGAEAIELGFADRVGSFSDTIAHMTAATRRAPMATGGPTMRLGTQEVTTQAELDAAVQAIVANARAETATAIETARNAGERVGANGAIARMRAILTHDETKGREALAMRLALETEMTAEAAVAVLQTSPKASAPAQVPPLSERSPAPVPGNAPAPQSGAATWDAIYDKLNKTHSVQPHPLA